MSIDKHYPTDPTDSSAPMRDEGDHVRPVKPCANRIAHENVSRFEASVGWCALPSGHDGQCSGPPPSVLEPNDLGPQGAKRRRW